MNGTGCNELLEACTSATTPSGCLSNRSGASASFAILLRLTQLPVCCIHRLNPQIGAFNQGDGPTTGGRPPQTSVLRSKLGGNAPITCHCSVSKKLHTQGACDRHLLRVQGVRLQIVCHNGGESPWRQRLHEVDRWPSLGSNAGAVSGSRALVGALGLRVVMEKIAHNLAKSGS